MQLLEQILSCKDQSVKPYTKAPKNNAQYQIKPKRWGGRIFQQANIDDGLVAVQQAKYDARHDYANEHRFNRNQAIPKLRAHLFKYEQDAGQRRVKGRR